MVTNRRLERVMEYYKQHGKLSARDKFGLSEQSFERYLRRARQIGVDIVVTDEDIMAENLKLDKTKQKQMDMLRILRKQKRESSRVENAITEYAREISDQNMFFAQELSKITLPKIKHSEVEKVGVIQVSDIHGNELIDLPNNQYNFNILSARLKRLADESIAMFIPQGITTILIAHTGDILNSDRRLDELLSQATNRAKASVLITYILTQFILHLRQHFEISVVSVMGNESRIDKDWHSNNKVVSNNYDYTIFANLKQKFEFAEIKGINFGSIDKMETVANIQGQNWLITHDTGKATEKQKGTQSKIGSYHLKGVSIDYIIAGHIHSARVTDISARCSSLAGSNEYNEHSMGLVGRASQNIYIVTEDSRNVIVVDLQNVDEDNRYSVINELKSYHTKSAMKNTEETTIFKVTI